MRVTTPFMHLALVVVLATLVADTAFAVVPPGHSKNDAGVAKRHGRARRDLRPRRTTSILNNPDPQPDLPTLAQADRAAAAEGLDLDNIQGDILCVSSFLQVSTD